MPDALERCLLICERSRGDLIMTWYLVARYLPTSQQTDILLQTLVQILLQMLIDINIEILDKIRATIRI